MSKQIRSTLAADTRYVEPPNGSSPIVARNVLVKGRGPSMPMVTEVSDDDAAFLAAHPHFKEHQQRGFVAFI